MRYSRLETRKNRPFKTMDVLRAMDYLLMTGFISFSELAAIKSPST